MRHAATGESMPDESRLTTVPAEPTGRPPMPRRLCAYTYTDPWTTSTHTVRSCPFICTFLSGNFSHRYAPTSWFISMESTGKSVWLRRAFTLNVSNGPVSSTARSAAAYISASSRSHT